MRRFEEERCKGCGARLVVIEPSWSEQHGGDPGYLEYSRCEKCGNPYCDNCSDEKLIEAFDMVLCNDCIKIENEKEQSAMPLNEALKYIGRSPLDVRNDCILQAQSIMF